MRCLLCIGLIIIAAPLPAADTAEGLIAKLGSPDFAEREAAGQSLLKMGFPALNAVREAAATSPNAEIRERAAAISETIAREKSSTRLLIVKKVTLNYHAMPLSAVIADFKTKTGLPLQLVPGKVADPNRSISVPAGDYEPWEALALILKEAGLREDHRVELPPPPEGTAKQQQQEMYRSKRFIDEDAQQQQAYSPATAPILLVDGVADALPVSRSGGIRITVLPPEFSANRIIRGAGRIVINLEVAPVPSTGWSAVSGIRVDSAEDEDGRPIFADLKVPHDPLASMNNYGYGWGGNRRVVFGGGGMITESFETMSFTSPYTNPRLEPLALRTNDRVVRKLKRLEGVIFGEIHTPNSPVIIIDKIEASIDEAFSGPMQSSLLVNKYQKESDGSVIVRYRYDSIAPWMLQQMRMGCANGLTVMTEANDPASRIKFFDADGKEITAGTLVSSNTTNNDGIRQQLEVEFKFPKGTKPPVKLVLNGTKVTPVERPFSFTDVRLP